MDRTLEELFEAFTNGITTEDIAAYLGMTRQQAETELSKRSDIYKLDDVWYLIGTGPGPIGEVMPSTSSGEEHQSEIQINLDNAGTEGRLFGDALQAFTKCCPDVKNPTLALRTNLRAMRDRNEVFNDPKTDRWWSTQYAPEELKHLVLETTRPTGTISLEPHPPSEPHEQYGSIAVTAEQVRVWREQKDLLLKPVVELATKSTRNQGVTSSQLVAFITNRLKRPDLLQQGKSTGVSPARTVSQICRYSENIYNVILPDGTYLWFNNNYGPVHSDHSLRNLYLKMMEKIEKNPRRPVGRPKKLPQELPTEPAAPAPVLPVIQPGYKALVQQQAPIFNVAAIGFTFEPNGPEAMVYHLNQPVQVLIGIEPNDQQRDSLITMAMGVHQVKAYERDTSRQLQVIPAGIFFAHRQDVYILKA